MDPNHPCLVVVITSRGNLHSALAYDPQESREASEWLERQLTKGRRQREYGELPLRVSWQNGRGKRHKMFRDFASVADHLNCHASDPRHHDFEIRHVPKRTSRQAKPTKTRRRVPGSILTRS